MKRQGSQDWPKNQTPRRKKMQKKSLISKGTTTKANATNSKLTPLSVRAAVKPTIRSKVAATLNAGIR